MGNKYSDIGDISPHIKESSPWVEKYRPKSLTGIISQTLTVQSLQEFVKKKTLPHLIFAGPAGTGKTSAAMSLIYDFLGTKNIPPDTILEKNASDEVRMKNLGQIKNFVFHRGITNTNGYKFVILDEADNIPKAVQSAFRRIIEMAPSNVKFIFMCNFVEKIIDPLLSRCAIFRFYPLPRKDFQNCISLIAKREKIKLTKDVIEAIFYISQGDMRQAINLLQMIVALHKETPDENIVINPDIIYEISGFLPLDKLDKIYKSCTSLEYVNTLRQVKKIQGFSSRGLFRQITTKVINNGYSFPKFEKILIMIAEYDYRLSLQADPQIQVDGFFSEFISLLGDIQ